MTSELIYWMADVLKYPKNYRSGEMVCEIR